jgi:hypothetical protein
MGTYLPCTITLPDMIFLTDPTMRISYTFHLLDYMTPDFHIPSRHVCELDTYEHFLCTRV